MAKPHSVRKIVTDPGYRNTGAPQAAVLRPSAPSWPGGPRFPAHSCSWPAAGRGQIRLSHRIGGSGSGLPFVHDLSFGHLFFGQVAPY